MTTKVTITKQKSSHDVVVVVLGETLGRAHVEQSRHQLTDDVPTDFYVHLYQVLSIEEVK